MDRATRHRSATRSLPRQRRPSNRLPAVAPTRRASHPDRVLLHGGRLRSRSGILPGLKRRQRRRWRAEHARARARHLFRDSEKQRRAERRGHHRVQPHHRVQQRRLGTPGQRRGPKGSTSLTSSRNPRSQTGLPHRYSATGNKRSYLAMTSFTSPACLVIPGGLEYRAQGAATVGRRAATTPRSPSRSPAGTSRSASKSTKARRSNTKRRKWPRYTARSRK